MKCTHGSTVGQLDDEPIFYLRSRGIGEDAARSLLTYAFANDIVGRIKVAPCAASSRYLVPASPGRRRAPVGVRIRGRRRMATGRRRAGSNSGGIAASKDPQPSARKPCRASTWRGSAATSRSSPSASTASRWSTSTTPPRRRSRGRSSTPSPTFYDARQRQRPPRRAHAVAGGDRARTRRRARKVQRFLNAADPGEIVFIRGTTEAINLVAQSFGRLRVGAGDEVLVTALEHHSNIVPWQMLCAEQAAPGCSVVADRRPRRDARLDEFERCSPRARRIVAVAHVSNALGTVNPVKRDRRHGPRPRRRRCSSTAPRRCRTCASTCATSTATSTPSPATSCTARPASASSTARPSSSTRCRRTRAAAT